MTIQLLSDLAGISRETTGHIVHELKRREKINKNGKNWMVIK